MKSFRHISATIISALIVVLTGCVSDPLPYSSSELPEGLTLVVPSLPEFSTRATRADGEELKYTSLWFFAFHQSNGKTVAISLDDNEKALNIKNEYKGYPITLSPGEYNLYVVANYQGLSENISEEDLKAKLIDYKVQGDAYNGGIPEGGIPMSCDNSGFYVVEGNASTTSGGNIGGASYLTGTFSYDGSSTKALYADLTFACAKITIDARDFTGNTRTITDLKGSNISGQVPLIFNSEFNDYKTLFGTSSPRTPISPNSTDSPITFYLPERYVSENAANTQTSVSFNVGEKIVTLPLGELTDGSTSEENINQLPSETDRRKICRGTHYSYTLTAKGEINFKVEPWTPMQLLYKLHGPIFLHVDQTTVPVTAGKVTKLWYDSDAPLLKLESPIYDGKPLYLSKFENDSISVWVNPEIKSANFKTIMNDQEGKYNYFHIVAGNLHKKIDVSPLKLKNYLNVTPQTITIDVREQIASGNYESYFPVIIDTNYPKVKVKRVEGKWGEVLPEDEWGNNIKPEDYVIQLADKDGKQLPVGTGGNTFKTTGATELRLKFNHLNSAKKTWQSQRQLQFTVIPIDEDGKELTDQNKDVTVNIIPNIQNYKIHFRADGWSNPHIYVYQCLEFPSDVKEKYLANQPIATSHEGKTAALEYSFTGKIAFKGWNVGNYNNPNQSVGGKVQGFYYFTENTESWDPADDKFTNHYYNDMDFCSTHRAEIASACRDCNISTPSKTTGELIHEEGYNRLWPGIRMKDEGNGWWYFELTGVATPGKALIMFSDGHYFKDNQNRFPKGNAVGIPLFDFPNREGWLYYNGDIEDRIGNSFQQTNPDNEPSKDYRLYWPQSKGSKIHIWYAYNKDITVWNNNPQGIPTSDGFYYYEFNLRGKDNQQLSIHYRRNDNDTDEKIQKFTQLGAFTEVDGKFCYTLYEGDKRKPGVPQPLQPIIIGTDIRLLWRNGNQIHVWHENGKDITKWPGGITGTLDNNYKYFDFTTNEQCIRLGFIRTWNESNKVDPNDQFISWDDLEKSYDPSIQKYVYIID